MNSLTLLYGMSVCRRTLYRHMERMIRLLVLMTTFSLVVSVSTAGTTTRREKLTDRRSLAMTRSAPPSFTETSGTWVKLSSLTPEGFDLRSVTCSPSGVVWVGGFDIITLKDYVWYSSDYGSTWAKHTVPSDTVGFTEIAALNDSTGVLGTFDGRVLRTTDRGTSWIDVYHYGDGWGWFNGVRVISGDTLVAFGDADEHGLLVVRSFDGGLTWTRSPNLPAEEAIPFKWFSYSTYRQAMDVRGATVWITVYTGSGTYPRIVKSTDAGGTWTSWEVPLTGGANNQYLIRSIMFVDDNLGYIVSRRAVSGQDNWLHRTTDGGLTFGDTLSFESGVPHNDQQPRTVWHVRGTDSLLALGFGGSDATARSLAYWSADRGQTWTPDHPPQSTTELTGAGFPAAGQCIIVGYSSAFARSASEDVTAPSAPTNLVSNPSGWSNSPIFSIDWTSPVDPSGIAAAWYKLGTAPTHSSDGTSTTLKPFTVSAIAEGGQNLYVWLEDNLGNKDHTTRASTVIYYDATAPAGGTISVNNGAATTSTLVVTLNSLGATDDGGSGLDSMRFSNDNTVWSDWEVAAATKTGWSLSSYGGNSNAGQKRVYVRYRDKAGNVSATFSDDITYQGADDMAPGSPVSLSATPSSWANTNLFTINWTNPTDASGIAAAWYKLGTPPTSGTDGTRTTQKPFTVSATAEGGQILFAWLEDGAGNRDYTTRVATQLFLDGTPPYGGTVAINNGAATTPSPVVTLNSLGATDAGGSGVSQMRFTNDGLAWSSWEGYSATRAGWDLTSDGGGTAGGEKTVSVQYKDAAGNVSAAASDKITYVTTSVGIWASGIPDQFDLHQNYPNPFNPSTVIRFDLPVDAEVSLIVANTLGETVAVLESGQKAAGRYSIQFEAGHLPTGVYFYRLRAADYVETERMLLTK